MGGKGRPPPDSQRSACGPLRAEPVGELMPAVRAHERLAPMRRAQPHADAMGQKARHPRPRAGMRTDRAGRRCPFLPTLCPFRPSPSAHDPNRPRSTCYSATRMCAKCVTTPAHGCHTWPQRSQPNGRIRRSGPLTQTDVGSVGRTMFGPSSHATDAGRNTTGEVRGHGASKCPVAITPPSAP